MRTDRIPPDVLAVLARGTRGRLLASLRAAWRAAAIAAAHVRRQRARRELRRALRAYDALVRAVRKGAA